jgi:hypothetical protein
MGVVRIVGAEGEIEKDVILGMKGGSTR